MAPDVAGLPWEEAERMLRAAGVSFRTFIARPTRDFFKRDEQSLYVIRAKRGADGIWELALAARLLQTQRIGDK